MPTSGMDPGPRGRGDSDGGTPDAPVLPLPEEYVDSYDNYLENRGDHMHAGEDWAAPEGTPIYACEDGVVNSTVYDGYGNTIDLNVGRYVLRYAHLSDNGSSGPVRKGERIGAVGNTGSSFGAHLHYEVRTDGGGFGHEGTIAPEEYLSGAAPPGGGGGSGPGGDIGGSGAASPESIAKAASISTYLQFPALMVNEESVALTGDRSLLNDQQLLPFIEQLCQASLRSFQSMPNGNFFAFYPDYFGGLNHRTPYWEIDDLEIISGKIDLSDDALVTHMYVVGDTDTFDGNVDILDKIRTAGVVTVFNAFMADFLNGVSSPALRTKKKESQKEEKLSQKEYEKEIEKLPTLAKKERAIKFLKKYGARPAFEAAPMVRTPYFEKFLAYQKFCLAWSRQFLTTFEFTYMPELFPGGIVAFPNHGIQCFIDEVSHECDYQGGFVTRANLSAPAAIKDQNGIRHGPKKYVHEGMIRGNVFEQALGSGDDKKGSKDKSDGSDEWRDIL